MNIEGRNPVIEVLRSDKEVTRLYLQRDMNQDTKINELVKKARRKGIKIIRKSKSELDRLSKTGSHQGVIAVAKHIETQTLNNLVNDKLDAEEGVKLVFIREAFHEFNVGGIIRTAEAAGFDAVILPPKMSVTPNIARASMGASEHIPIYSYSLFPLIRDLKKLNFKIIGIERTDESKLYTDVDMTDNVLLIIGGEDRSLSEQIISKCDDVVIIPQMGKVNSLNMSVAAAIVIYEIVRQNNP